MKHKLPPLPFEKTALEPYISAETLEYHYGKHHAKYVSNLNELIPGTQFEDMSLEEIIKRADGKIFNNAAQVWNHTFYWECIAPGGSDEPREELAEAIEDSFGSLKKFKEKFTDSAAALFGSGWTWLVKKPDGSLEIINASNAGTPISEEINVPLLTCDVWEHAYYIDYRNARPKYLDAFWNLVNWNFVSEQYMASMLQKTAH